LSLIALSLALAAGDFSGFAESEIASAISLALSLAFEIF
jgi:hypothetical protein